MFGSSLHKKLINQKRKSNQLGVCDDDGIWISNLVQYSSE